MHLEAEELILTGSPICRGIAIGKLFFLNRGEFKVFELKLRAADMNREIERYRAALSRSKQDIKRLQKQLESESALEGILILDGQLEMLQDPLLTIDIEKEIRKTKKNAEFVFQQAVTKFQERFNSLDDPFFMERFKDLQDLSRRILGYLNESGHLSLNDVPPNSIVCSQELTPSDTAEAKTSCVEAFITETGGVASHASIVSKAKGIPYITGINLEVIKANSEALVVVDGRTGTIILNPSEDTIKKYEHLKEQIQHQAKNLERIIQWPAETYDGYTIRLSANLETADEIDLVHQFGGHGVGLFRSEYIFLPKNEIPSEEEQFYIYSQIAEKMKGFPVVIRTFDLGGDKASLHAFIGERNPFIGCRATRYLLKERLLLKAQLRAILRANLYGNVSILFPMISTLSELRLAKQMVDEVKEELHITQKVPVGCMIEVPSAALTADHFAKECDFLSIGTNDLLQYSLAIDRSDQTLSEFYEPTDPGVIRLIKLITTAANQARVPVTVCGEIASDPRFTPLLLGLGIQGLSVTPRYLPLIKNAIRNTSIIDAVHLAEKVLHMNTSQDVLRLLVQEYQKIMPHDLFYNP